MPLIVSECGELGCNGTYYQTSNNPQVYMQSNNKYKIIEKIHTINQGYGGYKQRVWILEKLDPDTNMSCHLFVSCSNNVDNNKPFAENKLQWKCITGNLSAPIVRNGVKQNKQGTNGNNNDNLSRKRTFGMFINWDTDNNKNEPPNKKMRFNNNGNRCNNNIDFNFKWNNWGNRNNANENFNGTEKENYFPIK
eukprot:UN09332